MAREPILEIREGREDARESAGGSRELTKLASDVGRLTRDLPGYVHNPPIEAVVFGWGVAEDGQLGVDTDQNVRSPKVVEALLGTRLKGRSFTTTPLVAGSRNTLALDSEGQVLSWGWNARGTLGHGDRGTERKPRRVQGLTGIRIVQVAIGGWHCLAVDEAGQVYAWGGNEYGQCALPEEQRDITKLTPIVSHLKVVHVNAGGMHSSVVTESGEVWTWGEPWGDFSMKVKREPRQVIGAHHVAKIACGAFHNLALTWEGDVLSWGINDYGQLGNGSTVYETEPVAVVGLDGVRVADIAAGGWHSAALSASGEVYVWGRGEYGRLGLGDRTGSSKLRAMKVRAMEGQRVVQISCGGTHTLALTDEGRIFTWGRGSFGRLGTGVEKDCLSPVEVFLPGGPDRWRVICVSAGGRHSVCLALPDNSDQTPTVTRRTSSVRFRGVPGRQETLEGQAHTGDEGSEIGSQDGALGEDYDDEEEPHIASAQQGEAGDGGDPLALPMGARLMGALEEEEEAESELSEGAASPEQAGYQRDLEGASSPDGSTFGTGLVEAVLESHDLRPGSRLSSGAIDDDAYHGAAPHEHFDK